MKTFYYLYKNKKYKWFNIYKAYIPKYKWNDDTKLTCVYCGHDDIFNGKEESLSYLFDVEEYSKRISKKKAEELLFLINL